MKSSSLQETENRGAEGATHPRITLDFIESQIKSTYYISGDKIRVHAQFSEYHDKGLPPSEQGAHLTICMMVLQSGFIVLGKSAPLSPNNFDEAKGRQFAYEDCVRQLWPLFAFAQLQGTYAGQI